MDFIRRTGTLLAPWFLMAGLILAMSLAESFR